MKVAAVDDTEAEDTTTSPPPLAIAVAVAIPSAPPLDNNNGSPNNDNILPQTDEEAQAVVESSRARGIANIREHCSQHLSLNPNSSYVTWIATLHPENAHVTIDPRFMIEGNPWLTVYEEAKDDLQKKYREYDGLDGGVVVTTVPPSSSNQVGQNETQTQQKNSRCGGGGGFVDYIIGSYLVVLGVAASFAFEVAASYCYLSYWVCCKIVAKCSPPGIFTWLPLSIAYILGKVFQLLDSVLLVSSIIVVESIAGANYVVCTILACSHERGKSMHQMTRKLPHLVRWAMRKKFEDWDPPRMHIHL